MAAPVATRVAVVGLGKMGLAIAERILAAGFPLAVHIGRPGARPISSRLGRRFSAPQRERCMLPTCA